MSQSKKDVRNAYDLAAQAYAEQFLNELDHKPKDVELLDRFARKIHSESQDSTESLVLDLGCGPGHTTNHLGRLGLDPLGIDLSPEMITKAQSLFPASNFSVGDFFELDFQDHSVSGILAFYCIVHLKVEQLATAFTEMNRVIRPGGTLLLSFHIGDESVYVDGFLGTSAALEFWPHRVEDVQQSLKLAGFDSLETIERSPYETEYPTRRCYVFATKNV